MIDIFIVLILAVLGVWASVFLGFWMGWKAARPEEPLINKDFDPGPSDAPEDDIWQEALTPEKGVSTI